jgi:hypothetical protein
MSVGKCSRPCAGDAEVKELAAAGLLEEPSSPRSPLPERWAGGGSRFWALAGESSDEESSEDRSEGRATAGCRSPRSGPSTVRLGDFLSPAWQRVDGAKLGVAGRRRKKFAPGGHGARWCREICPGGARSAAVSVPATVVQTGGKSSSCWCRRVRRWWCGRRCCPLVLRQARRRASGQRRRDGSRLVRGVRVRSLTRGVQ